MVNLERFTATQLSRTLKIQTALRGVEQLRDNAKALEREFAQTLPKISPYYRESAYNLIHYLAIRRHDIRDLQKQLSHLGLSSLGTMEAHVMASLNAVLQVLYQLNNQSIPEEISQDPPISFQVGGAMLAQHATEILGLSPEERRVRIMVTMPSEAADNPAIIDDLLEQGMNIMRINCAHDNPEVWGRMIKNLRYSEKKLAKSCRISFDLAGPKLRTGAIAPGLEVLKWRPQRNELGQVTHPAVVYFTTDPQSLDPHAIAVPIQGKLIEQAQIGDRIHFYDSRDRQRELKILEVTETSCIAETDYTAYVTSGIKISLYRDNDIIAEDAIATLPPIPQAIILTPGDLLKVVQGDILGQPAVFDEEDNLIEPEIVGCSLTEIFRDVQVGERIFFDDGKIAGIIKEVTPEAFLVKIISAVGGRSKLKSEKGINLPDTQLKLPALSEKDRQDLEFIARHGDMVALSFVQESKDIEEFFAYLKKIGGEHLGIILKIETQRAFNNLPQLLLTAMEKPPIAVMVARGDLGVELGFERLSEVQEEILWLCEAAHIPVIWATQVLESLAKGGMPSRAEVTDAAMGIRSECVMLNKGLYINKAMDFLCDVLQRMQDHQEKRVATLRKLRIAQTGGI